LSLNSVLFLLFNGSDLAEGFSAMRVGSIFKGSSIFVGSFFSGSLPPGLSLVGSGFLSGFAGVVGLFGSGFPGFFEGFLFHFLLMFYLTCYLVADYRGHYYDFPFYFI